MLRAMMERQHKLMSEASEDLRRLKFQDIRDLNEWIEGAVEGKEELPKSRGVERCSCCCEQGHSDGSSGSRSSETEGDLLLSDVGARRKDTEDTVGSSWVSEAPKWRVISLCQQWEFFKWTLKKIRDPSAKSRRHRRKEESAETRECASAPPLTSCTDCRKWRRRTEDIASEWRLL